MFLVILISNVVVDLGTAENAFLSRPIRSISGLILISVIAGYGLNRINATTNSGQHHQEKDK